MTLIEAMEEITSSGVSKYRIAKQLNITPIHVDKLLGNTSQPIKTVNKAIAENIEYLYHIRIDKRFINNEEPRQRHFRINKEGEFE